MKKASLIIRIILGSIVLVFGVNKFLQFMPTPPLPVEANEFMNALLKTGYLMYAVAIIEIVTGLMLLINVFQRLALVLLFPVLLNAFWFHLFLDPSGIAGAFICMAMNHFLFFANKEAYKSILKFR
jgi:putative oxidoreductase